MYKILSGLFVLTLCTLAHAQEDRWTTFEWLSFTVGVRTFDKAAIFFPIRVENSDYWIQLDTGIASSTLFQFAIKKHNLTVMTGAGDSSKAVPPNEMLHRNHLGSRSFPTRSCTHRFSKVSGDTPFCRAILQTFADNAISTGK